MNENDFLSKITPVTSDQISEHPAELLWLIQSSLETKGPYLQDDLINLIDLHSNKLAECIACDLSHKRWKPFFDHKMFNKRDKNKISPVIKSEEKETNRYFVLVSGEKKGPYSQKDVEHFLDTGDLKLNDLLSADHGKSWRKIYHFPLFDRRKEQVTSDIGIESLDNSQLEKSRIFTTEMLQSLEDMPTKHSAIEGALIARRRHLSAKDKKYSRDNTQMSAVSETVMADFQAERKRSYLVPALTACLLFIAVGMNFMPGGDKKVSKKTKKVKTRVASGEVENIRVKDVEVKPTKRKRRSSSNTARKRVSMRSRVSNSDIEVPTDPVFVPPAEPEVRFPQPKPRTRRRRRRVPSVANTEPVMDEYGEEAEGMMDDDLQTAQGLNPGDEDFGEEIERGIAGEENQFLDPDFDPGEFPEEDPLDEFE